MLDELSKIVTTYGIIKNGVLVEEISSDELLSRCQQSFKLTATPVDQTAGLLKERYSFTNLWIEDGSFKITDPIESIPELIRFLVQNDIDIEEATMLNCSLEDYFIERMV